MVAVRDQGSDSMRMWGALLKRLRNLAGKSQEELAQYAGYSKGLVAGVEAGTRMPSSVMVRKCDEFVNAGGLLIETAKHLSRQRYPMWFREYVDLEQAALSLWVYDTHVVNGLLQTEDYARSVFAVRLPALDEDEIQQRVEARLERQELLTRRKPTCTLSFVVEESVLRQLVGGKEVMKAQLQHLLELAAYRYLSIQVLPTVHEAHAGVDGPMTLLETPHHDWFAYVEAQGVGLLIDETDRVSHLHMRYSMIRSQALTPRDSRKLIEQIAGEL